MAGINLIIDSYKELSNNKLVLKKSNTANRVTIIPYEMTSYQPLIDHCEQFVPDEWRNTIQNLYQQERELIRTRQKLIAAYKLTLQPILDAEIALFPSTHPEFFI